jgi:hypothetical protein
VSSIGNRLRRLEERGRGGRCGRSLYTVIRVVYDPPAAEEEGGGGVSYGAL